MSHSLAISKTFTVHQNKDAQSVPGSEQLTVYTVITKNSLICLMIYILEKRAQHLPILGDFPLYTATKSVSWWSLNSTPKNLPRSQTGRWRPYLPKFFQLIQTWNRILTSSFLTLYILHELQFCRTWHLLLFIVLPQFNLKAAVTVVADSSPTFTHNLTVMYVY